MLKRAIRPAAAKPAHDVFELGPEVSAEWTKLAAARLPPISFDVEDGKRGLQCDLAQLRRTAMNELGAKLDRHRERLAAAREDASTDSLTRLQYDDVDASVMKDSSCFEPGNAGANDRDIRSCVVHDGRCS